MRLALILFALFLSHCAIAKPYQIELIIFSHPVEMGAPTEYWPWVTPIAPPTGAHLIGSDAFPDLPRTKNHLNLIAQHIREAPGYEVLVHRSWIQDITSRSGAPMYLLANPYAMPLGSANGSPLSYQVTAKLNFSVNRYLDLSMDMVIREPLSVGHQQKSSYHTDSQFAYYAIKQKRRTKSSTLNYLDHPHLGVLIEFTPVPTA